MGSVNESSTARMYCLFTIAHMGSSAGIVGEAAFSLDELLYARRSEDPVVQDDGLRRADYSCLDSLA